MTLPEPRLRSERGLRASVREHEHGQYAQQAEHGRDAAYGTSGSQQLSTLDRLGDDRPQEPEQPDTSRRMRRTAQPTTGEVRESP